MPFFKKYQEISDERRDEMIEYLVDKVERVGMFVPAIFFLETGQPLSFVFSQIMYSGAPLGEIIVEDGQHRMEDYAQIFEDRSNLALLIDALQERAEQVQIEEEKEKLRIKRLKEKLKEEKQQTEEQSTKKKRFKLPWQR